MLLNQLRLIPNPSFLKLGVTYNSRSYRLGKRCLQTAKSQDLNMEPLPKLEATGPIETSNERIMGEIFPAARVVPMILTNKDQVVLSFEEVPGPRSLKYLSSVRHYLREIGTQLTAGFLTVGLNISTLASSRKPLKDLSTLFNEYGPVVRFVSPVGGDILLINHPDHIQKVYTLEGDNPVRSTLDSVEKYRLEHRHHAFGGLYTVHGQEWNRQRAMVYNPLHGAAMQHIDGVSDVCDALVQKIYNVRNYQDEVSKDLYKELHKWAFDSMGLILFSKRFTMLDTELVYSQCDMSWLYHSLDKATDAIIRCESGLHLWKLFPTPAWNSLVKYCDSLDNLIGKHVMEAEQSISFTAKENARTNSLIHSMLLSEDKMTAEDIATVITDMLLIGVNTITSSMSFLLYYLAKYQRAQKCLYDEIEKTCHRHIASNFTKLREETPYLQACIKETLRLVPPIPVLTRILPKNITLDRYNIPRGTLIIMSTQDSSLKESNFDNAAAFYPDRWLKPDAKDYHAFASIPFGHGARKCLGQNIAETMLTILTIKIMQKYKLEYHYGDIHPTRGFIARPNKALKIRFVDRV